MLQRTDARRRSLARQVADVAGYEPGQALEISEIFKAGDYVDVAGNTIGKGFQGEARPPAPRPKRGRRQRGGALLEEPRQA